MLEIKKLGPIKLGPIARHKGVKGGRQRGETRGEREKKREEECRVLKTAQKFVGGAAGRPQNTCAIPRIREPVNAAPVAPRVACCVKKTAFFGVLLSKQSLIKRPRALRALRMRCLRVLIHKRTHLKPYACDTTDSGACPFVACVSPRCEKCVGHRDMVAPH